MTARLLRVALVLLVLIGSASSPALVDGRSVDQQAPGQPIVDCTGMRTTAARLKSGLPLQEEWIRRTEAQLRAAEAGVVESKSDLLAAGLDGAQLLFEQQLDLATKAMDAVEAAQGFSSLARKRWLDRVAKFKDAAEKLKGAVASRAAGTALGTAVAENRASVQQFLDFLQESGITDEAAANVAMMFTGPAGALVVKSFTVSRDLLYAGLEGVMTAREADVARENLDKMRAAKGAVESRVAELEHFIALDCAPPAAEPRDRMLVQNPAEPPVAPPSQPAAPADPKTSKVSAKNGKGMSPSTALTLAAAGAGLAVAGVGLASQAAEETAKCDSQETAAMTAMTSTQNALNYLAACGTQSCWDSRWGAFTSAWSSWANALGNWCTCMGANVSSYLGASEKAAIQELWMIGPSIGLYPGSLPSCFK